MNDDVSHLIGAGSAPALLHALNNARARLWPLVSVLGAALGPAMEVRYLPEWSPPRWHLAHLGWFEDWWFARNPLRRQGLQASAHAPRAPSPHPKEDRSGDPRQGTHAQRWHQELPTLERLRSELPQRRARTLRLLAGDSRLPAQAPALEPLRALLWHEANEVVCWLQMAQTLGLWPGDAAAPLWAPLPGAAQALHVPAGPYTLGAQAGHWLAPDDRAPETVVLDAYEIDAQVVSWGRYLPFVEAGGYDDAQWWTPQGWSWRQRLGAARPRHLGRDDTGGWQQAHFGRWVPVDPDAPALHLSAHEAQAWCRWAGRRLPSAHEWEAAARTAPGWVAGQVQEWTADAAAAAPRDDWGATSVHAAMPGEAPHRLMCGASLAHDACLHRPWASAIRADDFNAGFVGFRSCAAAAQDQPVVADEGSGEVKPPRRRRAAKSATPSA